MAISLKKGGSINLTKKAPALKKVMIGLGWEVLPGNHVDLDASIFMLGANGKLPSDDFFIFYNNLKSPMGALEHTGDNRSGVGEGDDEMILVNLPAVEPQVEEILIVSSIHDSAIKNHNFGLLKDAYIRIVDVETNVEVLRFDLDDQYPTSTEMEFGKLRKENNEWTFTALGNGTTKGLQGYVDIYA